MKRQEVHFRLTLPISILLGILGLGYFRNYIFSQCLFR